MNCVTKINSVGFIENVVPCFLVVAAPRYIYIGRIIGKYTFGWSVMA